MSLELFFPIANIALNPFLILGLGVGGGFISSLLGIGSGVLLMPALIMIGVPTSVAITSQLTNAIGTNFVGFLGYWRQRDVDLVLAGYLFAGGLLGAAVELFLLKIVRHQTNVSEQINFAYMTVLGILGICMLIQNIRSLHTVKAFSSGITMRHWMIYFPCHKIFMRSRTEMSIFVPLAVGFATGLLTSILGGGNSLFMTPIVTYLIGRSSPVVAGTTLLAGFAITTTFTLVHGLSSSANDIILVILLFLGSIFGSHIGVRVSYLLSRAYLGIAGAFVILLISFKFAYNYFSLKNVVINSNYSSSISLNDPNLSLKSKIGWLENDVINFAYTSPIGYLLLGIISVIIMAFIIEKILTTLSIIRKNNP